MKQGSHKKYEMYNMHYGTVEDVDMSKSDHGFVKVKDVKPLSFKRGFVKSFSHNPIGIKVMYDRKFFTADQLQAMKVFMTKYETKKWVKAVLAFADYYYILSLNHVNMFSIRIM